MPNNVFPYPGNKARHSEWILEHIPEHECYVELFGGAAGVLFNKPRSKIEVYNDLNGDIPHFFRVLRDNCEELQEWLRDVPFSRDIHNKWGDEYYDGYRPEDDIERAGRFFTLRYTQFGGVSYAKKGFATKSTGDPAGPFESKIEMLYDFRERLRGVVIENLDWSEIVNRYDREETLFYADPPYPDDENEGYYNSSGFDQRAFHDKMSNASGDVVISLDRIPPFYDERWEVVSKHSKFHLNSKGGGNKDASEYLIMNYDSDGEQIMSDVGQQGLGAFE